MSKKWVSGEFKTPRDLIVALLGEDDVYHVTKNSVELNDNGSVHMLQKNGFTLYPDDVYLWDFGYMKEIPWYERIPEHGVLVRHNYLGIASIKSVDDEGYILGHMASGEHIHVDDVTLLTNEEIKQFLIEE